MVINGIGIVFFLALLISFIGLIVSLFRRRMNTKLFGTATVILFVLFLGTYLIHCKTTPSASPQPTPVYSFAPPEETPSPTPMPTPTEVPATPSPSPTAPAKKTPKTPVRTPQYDVTPATQAPAQPEEPAQMPPQLDPYTEAPAPDAA